jgi:hypothetical protein
MHARLEELISLRDRQPVAADSASHVAACAQCRAELGRLVSVRVALASLAPFHPPAQAWQQITQRLAARPAQPARPARASPRRPASAALVATLAVASLAALLVAAPWRLATQQSASPTNGSGAAGSARGATPLAVLVARSQQLEASLHALPQRPAVEVAANSAAIDALQARIQWLDTQLASEPVNGVRGGDPQAYTRSLWQTRVQLLNSLVGVRYAEAVHAKYAVTTGQGET